MGDAEWPHKQREITGDRETNSVLVSQLRSMADSLKQEASKNGQDSVFLTIQAHILERAVFYIQNSKFASGLEFNISNLRGLITSLDDEVLDSLKKQSRGIDLQSIPLVWKAPQIDLAIYNVLYTYGLVLPMEKNQG